MAINKKLIHFQTLANFEAQLSAGNILDTSICFIKDANKIWTHGQFYDCDVQIMNDGGEGRVVLGHNNQTIYPYTLASQVQAGSSDLDTYLNNLADVATSGSYNDLKNKPTIPSAVTESTVSGWGFTKNTGTYSKPSTGIPKTDLTSAVQTSLGKADTALQSYTEKYKGTVTGVKINGTTKNPSSGVVDLGTVITAHQTLKTINGESIVGSGDITISGGSSDANVQAVDTGDVLDDVAVEYVTKAYFDSVVGDINGILESIINGGGSATLITFTIAGTEYQAEEGMTWVDWVNSEYNRMFMIQGAYIGLNGELVSDAEGILIQNSSIIESNGEYNLM